MSRDCKVVVEAPIGDFTNVKVAGFIPEPVQSIGDKGLLGAIRLKKVLTLD